MAERASTFLNEAQARHLLATMAHVDDLLRQVDAMCDGAVSPFAREYPDIDADQARLLRSFTAAARRRMLEACDRLGVPRPEPRVSARWSAQTALAFAGIAFAELSPSSMRGYGALPPDAASAVGALSAALAALASRGEALLRVTEFDLAGRAAAVPGAAGEVLNSVEQLSRERGLHEIRSLLAAAIDRATSTTLDVGVFGRVSSGKSSLLNALLGAELLPVGAIPVTAVTVLVEAGDRAIEVRFLDGRTMRAMANVLPAFVTEELNAGNAKGVRSVTLTVPLVPRGMRFLDTPGVGSLGISGPALARASLPLCDLGLVLVAAGSPFGGDDLALAATLRRAGIPAAVLLSKADILGGRDLTASLEYLGTELDRALGPQHGVRVLPVSVTAHPEWLQRLKDEVLAPAAREHELGSTRALGRRLERLVALTADALSGHDGTLEVEMSAEAVRRTAAGEIRARADALSNGSSEVAEEAAQAAAEAWRSGGDARRAASGMISLAGGRAAGDITRVLRRAGETLQAGVPPRPPPFVAPKDLDWLPDLAPPKFSWAALGSARKRLGHVQPALAVTLTRFASQLVLWGDGILDEVIRDRERLPPDATVPPVLARAVELARELASEREVPHPAHEVDRPLVVEEGA